MHWSFRSLYPRSVLRLTIPKTPLPLPLTKPSTPTLTPYYYKPKRPATSSSRRTYTKSAPTMSHSSPAHPAEQRVQYNGKDYVAVKEGNASILYPPSQEAASTGAKKDLETGEEAQSVFYNPIQQFNRDLSALAIRAHGEHVLAEKRLRAEKKKQRAPKSKKRKRDESDVNGEPRESEPKEGETRQAEAKEAETETEKTRENEANATNETEAKAREDTTETNHEEPGAAEKQTATPSFTILDALSASGLRALRYASEIPFTTCVVANDFSPSAIDSMKLNIEYNKLGHLVRPNIGDARAYMYSLLNAPQRSGNNPAHVGKFDAIDLDPYGTAAPFMDASVQAVKDGGLLCVTCTDAGVFASNGYPEKSFALYGGIPVKATHSHEVGLRLILHALAASAAKYGLAIEPVLSLSIDFYVRVFVRVHRSQAETKFIAGNTILTYTCDQGCGAWSTQPLSQTKQKTDKKGRPFYGFSFSQGPVAGPNCEHCGFKTHVGGPMWGGPLHNPHFIQRILDMLPGADRNTYQTVDRIEGMLVTALEEDLDLAASTRDTTNVQAEHHHRTGTDTETADNKTKTKTPERSAIIPRVDPALREPHPFYFSLNALSGVLHARTMQTDAFRGALRHLGYRSTRSHTKPNTIRTDAPWDVIWEVMREWIRQKAPIKEDALSPGTAGAAIMAKSRENLRRPQQQQDGGQDQDQRLSALKAEISSAVESGADVGDLVTKIEAALYRSGARDSSSFSAWKKLEEEPSGSGHDAEGKVSVQGGGQQVQQKTTSTAPGGGKPHPSTLDIVFDEALGREVSSANRKKRLVRYQMNPRANWGPMSRASGNANK